MLRSFPGIVRILLALVLLGLILAFGTLLYVRSVLAPVAADPTGTESIAFEVEPGDTLGRVAWELEQKGLIRDARAARWLARAEDLASRLKTGEYELSPSQSTREILETLSRGRVRTHAIVIPEGLRAAEIADRLDAAGLADRETFLAVVFDPDSPARMGVEGGSLEGYLFPDTYRFARGLPPEEIARSMVGEFLRVYRGLEPATNGMALSMLEEVTLASIVEKETGVAEERPLIAAVFLNRLKRGMRLETDPTVIYGIEGFDGNLRRFHLQDESNPYNTYKIRGLPPGPIANPGRDALRAVRHPADSSYLYFVSRNDGTHVFSKTYAEHEAAVDRFQRRRHRR
ncbi:MAG TPA: endolytic transglycosylase MltG [Deltaproteobacteria bacterium]|nr:endolytic transglycosylase MltG [Deltaproteobacteria bacterium]